MMITGCMKSTLERGPLANYLRIHAPIRAPIHKMVRRMVRRWSCASLELLLPV